MRHVNNIIGINNVTLIVTNAGFCLTGFNRFFCCEVGWVKMFKFKPQ